jgi:hypothetical protein
MQQEPQSRRAARWVAASVAVVAVGVLGYVMGSSAEVSSPAVAASTAPPGEETPQISDPVARPAPATGSGRDALTPGEVTRARQLSIDATLQAGTTDVTGATGPEVLSVELPGAQGADTTRRAAVLLYDYRTNRLLKRVVNLTAGRVENTFAATGMQPPATVREVNAAVQLLWTDQLASVLRDRFLATTGTALTTPDQLAFEAQTFAPGSGSRCGEHRCVMLLPHRPGEQFINLTDIVVDLSDRSVLRLAD